jgi:hypothetical protein
MKKIVLSILLLLPLFISAQSINFTESRVEYDAVFKGKTGMNFNYSFKVQGYQGQNLKAYMFICDPNNNPLTSYDNAYRSPEGYVSGLHSFTPKSQNESYSNFKIFIAYDALPAAVSNAPYHYYLVIKNSNNRTLHNSTLWNFDWASHSPNTNNVVQNNQHGTISYNNNGNVLNIDDNGNILIISDNQSVIQLNNGTYSINDVQINNNNNNNNNNNGNYDPNPYDYSKPTIEWLSGYESSTASFLAKAGIKSNSTISETNISVNGSAYRGMKTVRNDGYQMVVKENVTLRSGTNDITIYATNTNGTTTQTFQVVYNQPNPIPTTVENRVALVIGNANYPTQSLKTPVNDANDIATSLRQHGFDVITLTNATKRQMENAISQLKAKADQNSVALFYYAGHGIQKDGHNYLIPVDADPQSESDVEYTCTDVNRVLSNMEASGCTRNIVVLDACRNNPFERSWTRGGSTRGLTNINAPDGTFISYATSPGKVAYDGSGRNSPYAESLIQSLKTPQIELYDLFREVIADVKAKTNGAQSPWISTNFNGKFYF